MKDTKVCTIITGGYKIIDWLDQNRIEYTVIDTITHPNTFKLIPFKIRIINEKDYVWFKLNWS